jgi:hypothetical protein
VCRFCQGGGEYETVELSELIVRLGSGKSRIASPFAAERIAIIAELSTRLFVDQRIVEQPALKYFAHWIRRNSLLDLKNKFNATMSPGAFESLPLRNGGKSIWFGDRYSYAVISGPTLVASNPEQLHDLANKLAADIFTFNQMGCSSPHKLYITGSADTYANAVATFINTVSAAGSRRGVKIAPSHRMAKLTEAMAPAGTVPNARIPAYPELMLRMLVVGYCYGIRHERKLCEEVKLHLAYRWFRKLDLNDKVRHHSTFSENRLNRFRESDILRHVVERVVQACMRQGLVKGEGFAVDANKRVQFGHGLRSRGIDVFQLHFESFQQVTWWMAIARNANASIHATNPKQKAGA